MSAPLAQQPFKRAGYKLLLVVVAALVLVGVFSLYTHPQFLVSLADQLWACF